MRALLGIYLIFLCGASITPAAAQPAASQTLNGVVKIRYDAPSSRALSRSRDVVANYRVLEYLQNFLSPLRLPRDLTIVASQCNRERASYRSSPATVTICYEQVAKILTVVDAHAEPGSAEARIAVTGAMITSILHETALGIFDVLNVPIWGRLDDAADSLAAFIVTQFGEGATSISLLGTAKYLMWSHGTTSAAVLQSDQSPEMQRFFEFLCVGLGSDQLVTIPLVTNQLPDNVFALNRFRRCAASTTHIRKAFNLRIMPYIDPQKLVRARAAFP
jgi:hypothetical protein